ncbi:MAG: hypothetical protein AVDCRST_MAG37-702, partial [uncultured Rubrobacteraceae bacterium]
EGRIGVSLCALRGGDGRADWIDRERGARPRRGWPAKRATGGDPLGLRRAPGEPGREVRPGTVGRGWQVSHLGGRVCRDRHGTVPGIEADRRGHSPAGAAGDRLRPAAAARAYRLGACGPSAQCGAGSALWHPWSRL